MNGPDGRIQDAELEIMRVLWENGGTLPLIDIRHELSIRRGWEDSTIKTLVRRLQQKGAVRLERRGVYSALVTEDAYKQRSARAFVDKLFAGSAKQLVASMVQGGQLNKQDIAELAALLKAGEQDE